MLDEFGMNPVLYTTLFIFFGFAYIVGELIQRKRSSIGSDLLITLGSLWFVCIVHFFFTCVAYDIIWGFNFAFHWLSSEQMAAIAYHMTWGIVVATFIFLCLGYLNARMPAIREHILNLDKKNPLHDTLRIVVASDIHLGPINGRIYVRRIVRMINALNPDLILLPGDILDGEVDPVIRRDLGKYLKKLSANHGIFGITGNHEFIGGIDRAAKYITDHGITLLRDEAHEVAGITLIGREDIASTRFCMERKALPEIMENVNSETALILMDHQPKHLKDARDSNIDIQLSGHTHNGQLFPLNFIVKKVFEIAQGYKKIGDTHYFVSCGLGTWGPPVRTNARPEILVLNVNFNS